MLAYANREGLCTDPPKNRETNLFVSLSLFLFVSLFRYPLFASLFRAFLCETFVFSLCPLYPFHSFLLFLFFFFAFDFQVLPPCFRPFAFCRILALIVSAFFQTTFTVFFTFRFIPFQSFLPYQPIV